MKAAWYEKQGPAREVLKVGDMPDPTPAPGEVRIRVPASGINPGDIKKREDAFGYGMAYPRVIPHSDGAGQIDRVGDDVSPEWIARRVWCYGAQSYRPFGTAAEFTVVPLDHVASLSQNVSTEQGACLGIPGITAHRAVHVAGPVSGRTVLVQGAGGPVGLCAVQLARYAGARIEGSRSAGAGSDTYSIRNRSVIGGGTLAFAPRQHVKIYGLRVKQIFLVILIQSLPGIVEHRDLAGSRLAGAHRKIVQFLRVGPAN